MALIVMKFGGTSVADKVKIENVATIIENAVKRGDHVVAVLSAQGNTTDELVKKAESISQNPDKRELDMLLSAGEQISVSLCAMALKDRGIDAVSLTGWQAGIMTDGNYGDADVTKIDTKRLRAELESGKVVVLAGFQGVTDDFNISTLGRGGSDTTAVCVAAFLNADQCRIYKDVDGIYTADPKKDSMAVRFPEISYDDMLKLADSGAKVLHKKCVEEAKKHGIEIMVLSSFSPGGGTIVR